LIGESDWIYFIEGETAVLELKNGTIGLVRASKRPDVPVDYKFYCPSFYIVLICSIIFFEIGAEDTSLKTNRLKSVDCLRGICVAAMVFVNYGGGGFWFVQHAPWDGVTFADLVFPLFAFVQGISMAFGSKDLKSILSRSFKFFLIGYFVINRYSGRVMGVLQRLGIANLVVGILTFMSQRMQCLFVCFLEIISIYLTFYYEYDPGNGSRCNPGYLGPGGISDSSENYDCIGGAANAIDKLILGESRMYRWTQARSIYYPEEFYFTNSGISFDPEGLLGSINNVVVTFLGLKCGQILNSSKNSSPYLELIAVGCVLSISSITLHCSYIPINKQLWSLSFILLSSGMGYFLIALLYNLIDQSNCSNQTGLWSGQPFLYFGRNSMLIYIGHSMLRGYFPFAWTSGRLGLSGHTEKLIQNIGSVIIWGYFARFCDSNRLYLTA